MNNTLAATLGELQAKIYWLHDAEDFDELAATVSKIYKSLGHKKERADIAGHLIGEAYQLADHAELASQAGSVLEEIQFYTQAKEKLILAETSLGFTTSIAEHQMKWWMYFRHKKMFLVILHLFLQHLKPLPRTNFLTALRLTYYLLQAGIGHNRRDFEMMKESGTKYWTLLLKTNPQGCPFLG